MLNVKNLTLLSPQKWKKKSGILTTVANLVSRFGLILTKILFSIEWK